MSEDYVRASSLPEGVPPICLAVAHFDGFSRVRRQSEVDGYSYSRH